MFDTIFNAIKAELGIGHLSDIVSSFSSLVSLFGSEYMKDGNARDAAIDALCQILQQHKTQK